MPAFHSQKSLPKVGDCPKFALHPGMIRFSCFSANVELLSSSPVEGEGRRNPEIFYCFNYSEIGNCDGRHYIK